MKEKKKMTKAEAFEWLKNKKLTAKIDAYVRVLLKLFECGIEWVHGGQSITYYGTDYLIIEDGQLFHCGGGDEEGYWKAHRFEEISVDDILSIEIVEEEEDTSMPTVEFERYIKILQAWSKRLNSSFVFSERGMGIIRGDLLTKLEGEEKGVYYKIEATL